MLLYRQIMAANGEKHKISCAMDHIIDAQMKGEISEENGIYIVENINVAAIETTLWSMEWAIAELVNHPTIQSKIRDEISKVLKGEPVTESNLTSHCERDIETSHTNSSSGAPHESGRSKARRAHYSKRVKGGGECLVACQRPIMVEESRRVQARKVLGRGMCNRCSCRRKS